MRDPIEQIMNSSFQTLTLRKDALRKSHFFSLSRRAWWQGCQTVEKFRDSWNSSFQTLTLRKDALRKSHFFSLSRRAWWQGYQTVERVRDSWNSSFRAAI